MDSLLLFFLLLGGTLAKPLPQDSIDLSILLSTRIPLSTGPSLSTGIPLSTGGVSTTDTATGWDSNILSDTLLSTSKATTLPPVTSDSGASSSAISTTESTTSDTVTPSTTSDAAASHSTLLSGSPTPDTDTVTPSTTSDAAADPSTLLPGSPTSDTIAPFTTLGPIAGSSTVLQDPVTTSSNGDGIPNFTSTVTIEPPDFSTETITGITSNTILHTTGTNGQPTDVAVIHDDGDDDDDDDNDVGIVLWGIPLVVGILFDLPLPILPNIYFPCPGCIPVIVPGTEGSDGPDDPDDPTSDSPNSSNPATSDRPSSTASQESSSSSLSSSSALVCTLRNGVPHNTKTVESYGPPDPSSFSSMSAPVSATSDQAASSTDSSLLSTSTNLNPSMTSGLKSTLVSTATPSITSALVSRFQSDAIVSSSTSPSPSLSPMSSSAPNGPLTESSNFHNELRDGWITVKTMSQNDVTTQNVQVTYGSSTRVFDGWVQYWSDTCNGITTYTWPGSYGDVYLKDDGYLYDSSNTKIGTNWIQCVAQIHGRK